MSNELLTVKGINKYFTGVHALKDVNFSMKKGEVRCLAGENGSGKSTLIKIIGGVYEQDEGEIYINGKKYEDLRPIDAINEGIQIIFQDFSLFPNLTVAENLAINEQISRDNKMINWNNIKKTAQKALEQINLDVDIWQKLEELSIADRQLVAIARALLYDARLIIMDEPTSALTRKEVNNLFNIINDLKAQGISILFVSHKLNEVFAVADNITILRSGKKVFDGSAEELDRKKLEYHMTGRNLSDTQPYIYEGTSEPPLLRVENLDKSGKFSGVSFELYEGEILGITGLLGSGRTELAYSLFGLKPVDSGEFYIQGEKKNIQSVEEAMNNSIGYVPEDRLTEGLLLDQSVSDNINICTIDELADESGFIAFDDKEKQARQWVDKLDIKISSLKGLVKSLSGGNQQRVVIAKWLATRPRILILNGPTVGVDVGSKEQIHKLLRDMARDGMGIIIISDDIPEVVNNCNRILLMKEGSIAESFNNTEINEDFLSKKLLEEV